MNSLGTSLKVCALVVLGTSGLGLVSLQSGCAATPTKESTGEVVDDSTITVKVKTAFIKDDVVKSSAISVVTFKGVVQLSGFVDNSAQKYRAGKVAGAVRGVVAVQNNISVK